MIRMHITLLHCMFYLAALRMRTEAVCTTMMIDDEDVV